MNKIRLLAAVLALTAAMSVVSCEKKAAAAKTQYRIISHLNRSRKLILKV